MELFKSLRLFVIGIVKRLYWILPTMLLDPFDLIERLFNVNYDVPQWAVWSLFAAGLMVAIVLAFHELRVQKVMLEKPINWIDAYESEHGELPPVPEYLLPVVQNYSHGESISKRIQLITPSAQFWSRLLPSQQDQLLELVKWLGQDPRDYLEVMKRMSPPKRFVAF